ncbi:MAG: HAD-IIA family hydrolase [Acidimicrobiales bacterium]
MPDAKILASVAPGTWIVDLDGVVWLGGVPIKGVAPAAAALRDLGVRIVFATNNSSPTTKELCERVRGAGLACSESELITSGQAAATLLSPGDRVLALSGAGAREAIESRGCRLVESGPSDVVVVGWTDNFDFDSLARAATAVRSGARLIGTNDDATLPSPTGPLPGAGSLLAAVVTASGTKADVAGKPYTPMVDLIRSAFPQVSLVVGDRPSTDGLLARALGAPFALVLSGATQSAEGADPPGDLVAADLGELAEMVASTS